MNSFDFMPNRTNLYQICMLELGSLHSAKYVVFVPIIVIASMLSQINSLWNIFYFGATKRYSSTIHTILFFDPNLLHENSTHFSSQSSELMDEYDTYIKIIINIFAIVNRWFFSLNHLFLVLWLNSEFILDYKYWI